MLPFSKPGFDEFKDQRYADWRRIRLAIEHENTLVNHRITWLLTSQGFIVAGIVAVLNEALKPEGVNQAIACIITMVLSVVSFSISRAIHRSLKEADIQLDHLDKWWYSYWAPPGLNWDDKSWNDHEIWKKLIDKSREDGHPEIQGRRRDKFSRFGPVNFRHVAKLLQYIWLALLIASSGYLVYLGISASQRAETEGVDPRLLRIPNYRQQAIERKIDRSKDNLGKGLIDNTNSILVYLPLKLGFPRPYKDVKTRSDALWDNWHLVRLYSRLAESDRILYVDLAIARNNLASTLGDMKSWEEARIEGGKALEVAQRIPVGAQSYGVLPAIQNNLGVFNKEVGYLRTASEFFQSSKIGYQKLNYNDKNYHEQIKVVQRNALLAD
jgi:hypothetical protein